MLRRLHPRVTDRGPETAAPERFDIRDPYGTADDREEQERDPRSQLHAAAIADAWLSTRSARRAELRAVERWCPRADPTPFIFHPFHGSRPYGLRDRLKGERL